MFSCHLIFYKGKRKAPQSGGTNNRLKRVLCFCVYQTLYLATTRFHKNSSPLPRLSKCYLYLTAQNQNKRIHTSFQQLQNRQIAFRNVLSLDATLVSGTFVTSSLLFSQEFSGKNGIADDGRFMHTALYAQEAAFGNAKQSQH